MDGCLRLFVRLFLVILFSALTVLRFGHMKSPNDMQNGSADY